MPYESTKKLNLLSLLSTFLLAFFFQRNETLKIFLKIEIKDSFTDLHIWEGNRRADRK